MGRVVSDLAQAEQDLKIVCGVDINTAQHYDFPVFGTMQEAAGTHSMLLGCGREELLKKNIVSIEINTIY